MLSTFTIATNYIYNDIRNKKKKETVEFHSIVAWGKLAKIINKYLTKGSKVYLEGRLHTRSWKDKSGQIHYRTEVVASDLIMLGGGSKKEETKQEELAREDIEMEEVPVDEG